MHACKQFDLRSGQRKRLAKKTNVQRRKDIGAIVEKNQIKFEQVLVPPPDALAAAVHLQPDHISYCLRKSVCATGGFAPRFPLNCVASSVDVCSLQGTLGDLDDIKLALPTAGSLSLLSPSFSTCFTPTLPPLSPSIKRRAVSFSTRIRPLA